MCLIRGKKKSGCVCGVFWSFPEMCAIFTMVTAFAHRELHTVSIRDLLELVCGPVPEPVCLYHVMKKMGTPRKWEAGEIGLKRDRYGN